ncbi:MAG: nucleotidyltransferase family protein [Clostridia bacterium]|nr:nucleotidyltransferase family protein [Clostridia bacterium]
MAIDETGRAVCLLLRKALFGNGTFSEDEKKRFDAVKDWEGVFQEMRAQSVFGLAEPILDELPLEPTLRQAWREQCERQQARWYRVVFGQNRLVFLLEEHRIPFVILKGTAAGMAYPNPVLRTAGDVDFLVRRADFERCGDLLSENGYRLTYDTSYASHHNEYERDSVSFEMHRWMGDLKETDEGLIALFERAIDRREPAQADTFTFPVLPPAENGLALLLHIKHHLRGGLGLRQIVDWMLFVQQKVDDAFWKEEYDAFLTSIGLKTLAITVTAMCRKYLGLDRTMTWCDGADEAVCDRLMSYILSQGNFGRKAGKDGHIASFWIKTKSPVRFFKRLQAGGMKRWKAAQKHPVLRPFAWFYQGLRIRRELREQGKSAEDLKKLHEVGKDQRDLMEQLGIR